METRNLVKEPIDSWSQPNLIGADTTTVPQGPSSQPKSEDVYWRVDPTYEIAESESTLIPLSILYRSCHQQLFEGSEMAGDQKIPNTYTINICVDIGWADIDSDYYYKMDKNLRTTYICRANRRGSFWHNLLRVVYWLSRWYNLLQVVSESGNFFSWYYTICIVFFLLSIVAHRAMLTKHRC